MRKQTVLHTNIAMSTCADRVVGLLKPRSIGCIQLEIWFLELIPLFSLTHNFGHGKAFDI